MLLLSVELDLLLNGICYFSPYRGCVVCPFDTDASLALPRVGVLVPYCTITTTTLLIFDALFVQKPKANLLAVLSVDLVAIAC